MQGCRRKEIIFIILVVVLGVTQATSASAATYYVDPSPPATSSCGLTTSCSDANNGTTPATAWLNPPGTRTASNSGFYSSSWGSIATSNKIKCGDTILLKGGATQTNVTGGAWRIDGNYYGACTSGNRTQILVATPAQWTGSSGNFVLNGTGITPTCVTGCGAGGFAGLVDFDNGVNFIIVGGNSDAQRLAVENSSSGTGGSGGNGVELHGGVSGIRVQWVFSHANNFGGVTIGTASNYLITDTIVQDNGHTGMSTGMWVDARSTDAGFVNITSIHNGLLDTNGFQGDGLFFVGDRSIWLVNCTVHDETFRGVNTGVENNCGMGGDFLARFRNLVAYNNGLGCPGSSGCLGAGVDTSGNQGCNADLQRNYFVGAIIFHNGSIGFGNYSNSQNELWHGVLYNTNATRNDTGSLHFDVTAHDQRIFNSISVMDNTTNSNFCDTGDANGAEPQLFTPPTALSNCFRPKSANSEPLGCTYLGSGWPGAGTYASPPAWIPAGSNQLGLTQCNPHFAALNTTVYASNDFHLTVGSTAIDAGRFLMLANGAGTCSSAPCTITVKANGGGSDPRYYFISPASYLDATPDTIQIKDAACTNALADLGSQERAKIASMTATSITLDRSCTWADGAGVHLPWAGSAPDMGAYEFGLSSGLLGDLDANGVVDILDLQHLVNVLLGLETNPRADLDGDGSATILDLQRLVNILLGV